MEDLSSPDEKTAESSADDKPCDVEIAPEGEAKLCSVRFEENGVVIRCSDQEAVDRLLNAMTDGKIAFEFDKGEHEKR